MIGKKEDKNIKQYLIKKEQSPEQRLIQLKRTTLPLMTAVAITSVLYSTFTSLDLLGSAQYIAFFILSLILRVIQGFTSAAIQICAFSFATFEMNHEKDTYIGYVEMALGVGAMGGPAVASFLFDYIGYNSRYIK
ncbi:permeases of the major facilitator superfamily [Stylonychia lemnae]|uniref:Permeases of the major facilitator superfamily n=1 Tax=Stylonychia lemnae TaxID=5949 RepID=A0A078B4G9_STYLE|nr:permeases of the major facilitator superfamily [Stylonychia lemnae]|eukprot:CDW89415.1 permeases of the major facilitator superfamily [Stylonychia lemnae]